MMLLDEAGVARVGAALAPLLQPGDVVALHGSLGAGKTTLARAVLAAMGHAGDVPSPTFAILQPYEDLPVPILHADLYRVEDGAELRELGIDDWLTFGAMLVEWPERAGVDAFPQALRLTLEGSGDDRRALTWQVPRSWGHRWPPPALRP